MLRHGGAPIWTALTVKTGEITGISVPTAKYGPGPIRTLIPEHDGSPKALKTQGLICVLLAEKFGSYGGFLSLNSEHFKTVLEVQYFPGVFRIY